MSHEKMTRLTDLTDSFMSLFLCASPAAVLFFLQCQSWGQSLWPSGPLLIVTAGSLTHWLLLPLFTHIRGYTHKIKALYKNQSSPLNLRNQEMWLIIKINDTHTGTSNVSPTLTHTDAAGCSLRVSMSECFVLLVVLCSGFASLIWPPACLHHRLAALPDNTLLFSHGALWRPLLATHSHPQNTQLWMNCVGTEITDQCSGWRWRVETSLITHLSRENDKYYAAVLCCIIVNWTINKTPNHLSLCDTFSLFYGIL